MVPSALHPTLELTFRQEADSLYLIVGGDLDRGNAWALTSAVIRSKSSPTARLVLDLEGLRFIEAGGLRALADIARRTRRQGRTLQLAHVPDDTVRLLRLTGLDHVLEVLAPERA
jgi:anti-sigma B factor antagonist